MVSTCCNKAAIDIKAVLALDRIRIGSIYGYAARIYAHDAGSTPARSTMKPLAKQLREERERQGMTQEDLAKLCGMHRTQLVQIENGGLIHEGTAAKIAKALGFTLTISPDNKCPTSASNAMASENEKA